MKSIAAIFARDLEKLASEIDSFNEEENLWETTGSVTNSAGNLCLHLIGNLNQFIGTTIGKSGYVRDREAEFNDKNIAKSKLLVMISETKQIVSHTILAVDNELMQTNYPSKVFGNEMTHEYFLIHLIGHLSYHLGQINYLRRIIDAK